MGGRGKGTLSCGEGGKEEKGGEQEPSICCLPPLIASALLFVESLQTFDIVWTHFVRCHRGWKLDSGYLVDRGWTLQKPQHMDNLSREDDFRADSSRRHNPGPLAGRNTLEHP